MKSLYSNSWRPLTDTEMEKIVKQLRTSSLDVDLAVALYDRLHDQFTTYKLVPDLGGDPFIIHDHIPQGVGWWRGWKWGKRWGVPDICNSLRLPAFFTAATRCLLSKSIHFATSGLLHYTNMVMLHCSKTTATSTKLLMKPPSVMSSETCLWWSFWEKFQTYQMFLPGWCNDIEFGIGILSLLCTNFLATPTLQRTWTYGYFMSIQPLATFASIGILYLGTGLGNKQ